MTKLDRDRDEWTKKTRNKPIEQMFQFARSYLTFRGGIFANFYVILLTLVRLPSEFDAA